MPKLGNLILTVFFLSFCFLQISAGRSNDEDTSVRSKRSYQQESLFPFPRAARSKDFPITWNVVAEDGKPKREGLIPLARVGRSGPKRNGGANNGGGLWFGPRLGRSQKRGDAWTLDQLNSNLFQGSPSESDEEKDARYSEDSSEKILAKLI